MAFQTLSSSLTAEHPAQPTTPTSPPAVEDPNKDSKNSIPFSFLIAFLALFVCFMALGLWARRIAYFLRRRLGVPIPEPRLKNAPPKPAKPIIWDVSPGEGGDIGRWGSMQPLSSWYRRQTVVLPGSCEQAADTRSSNATGRPPLTRVPSVTFGLVPGRGGFGRGMAMAPIPPPRQTSQHNNALSLRNLRRSVVSSISNYWRPMPPDDARSVKGGGRVEALQVAVFVEMPSPKGEKYRISLGEVSGELAIGIANIPWEKGELLLDGD